jgi:hypothetical protein
LIFKKSINSEKGFKMEFNIKKVNVSIDHITLTSDDTSPINFNPEVIKGFKYLGPRNMKKPKKNQKETYKSFLEYRHKNTGNKIQVYTDREKILSDKEDIEYNFFLPNITIKFFSSWDNPLSYGEVVGTGNDIIKEYNMALNLAQFPVAIGLYSDLKHNYIKDLKGLTKSGRIYDPDEDPKYPGTYYFHSNKNIKYPLRFVMYDKKKEILDKKKRISNKSLNELLNINVTRAEAKVYNTVMGMVSSTEALAKYCFVDLYPKHIQFLEPDETKLIKHGIDPIDYEGLRLKELRQLLREEGIRNNFFYYTKDNSQLSNIVKEALKEYKWCKNPDKYPINRPKLVLKPQKIQFIKH